MVRTRAGFTVCLYGVGPHVPVRSSSRAGLLTGSECSGIRGLPHVAGVSYENIGNCIYMAQGILECISGDPSFSKQQGSLQQKPSGSDNQQQHRQRGSRGSKQGGACGKGKQRANHPGHSHVASIVHFASDIALPGPTSHTVAPVRPSEISTCLVTQDQPKSRVPGVYPSLNKALTLAERLDVPATMQTVKSLEQRFTNFDNKV